MGLAGAIVSHQACRYAMRKEKAVMRRTVQEYNSAKMQQAKQKAEARVKQAQTRGGASEDRAELAPSTEGTKQPRPWYRLW